MEPERPVIEIMEEQSGDADLAVVGMRSADADEFYIRQERLLAVLPTTLLVFSARDFESEPVLLDEGEPSEG